MRIRQIQALDADRGHEQHARLVPFRILEAVYGGGPHWLGLVAVQQLDRDAVEVEQLKDN